MNATAMEVRNEKIEKDTKTALARAQSLAVTNTEECDLADQFCFGLLKLKKEIEADFKESKETAYAAWKAVVAQEKGHLDGIDEARKIVKGKMAVWQEAEEKKRREGEARLRAEALNAAAAAEKNGDKDGAEAILNTPIEAAPVVLPKTTPKTQTVVRKVWKFRVTNPSILPREYLTPDLTKIGGVVRSTQGTVKIPGVDAYQDIA